VDPGGGRTLRKPGPYQIFPEETRPNLSGGREKVLPTGRGNQRQPFRGINHVTRRLDVSLKATSRRPVMNECYGGLGGGTGVKKKAQETG